MLGFGSIGADGWRWLRVVRVLGFRVLGFRVKGASGVRG